MPEVESTITTTPASSEAQAGHESHRVSLDRPLTDVEVAARLGVSRFTVRAWRHKGQGPRFLKMGRAVRYRQADIEAFQRQTLVETQAG